MNNPPQEALFTKTDLWVCGLVFALALGGFAFTLAPSVYFGDSGELTAAAFNLGVAHPPGYPLYILLGKLFTLLVPIGDPALRMNLLSSVFGALVAVLVYLIARLMSRARLTAFLTSMLAVFSATFWSQAVIAEVYTLATLFFCLMLFLTLLWWTHKETRIILLLALTGGLALTHHVTIALYYPILLLMILYNQPTLLRQWRLVLKAVGLFLAPFVLYAYLPISSAANPLNDWGNPETFSALIDHVSASQFGDLFLKYGLDGFLFQGENFLSIAARQWPAVFFLMVLVGSVLEFRRDRRCATLIFLLMVVNLVFSLTYYITDIEAYFIPAFLLMALLAGCLLERCYVAAGQLKPVGLSKFAMAVLVLVCFWPAASNWAESDQSNNTMARDYGLNMLTSLAPDSALFVDGEAELFVLAYLKIVENVRPDVDLYDCRQNIFYIPEVRKRGKENMNIASLYRFAKGLLEKQRPVYFSNKIFADLGYEPHGLLFLVHARSSSSATTPDVWEKYDKRGLDRDHVDGPSRETVGKYYFSRARSLWTKGDRVGSNDFLEKALKAAGDQPLILKFASIFYMETNRQQEARPVLEKALKNDPFDSDFYSMLGMIAHNSADFPRALENYGHVLELRADDLSTRMNRAMLHEQMGDGASDPASKKRHYQDAKQDLERAKKAQPSNPQVGQSLGRLSYKLSQF